MNKIPLLTSEDIEVKVKTINKTGALALLYKTARTDRKYLNLIYGPLNWTSDFKVVNDSLFCGIGIRDNKDEAFVWKWESGGESENPLDDGAKAKANASDAFKRAGFAVGIGEELYTSPVIWMNVATKQRADGKWDLENKYAKYVVTDVEFNEDTRVMTKLKIANADSNVVVFDWCLATEGARAQKMVQTVQPAAKKTIKPAAPAPAPVAAPAPVPAPAEEPAEVTADDLANTTVEVLPLKTVVNRIGSIVKFLKDSNHMDEYNQTLIDVTGNATFKCNAATEDQYDTVLNIYKSLTAKGYNWQ